MNDKSPYSYEALNALIINYEAITGSRPKELIVTDKFYTWFTQECARDVENLKKYRNIKAILPKETQHLGVLIKRKK